MNSIRRCVCKCEDFEIDGNKQNVDLEFKVTNYTDPTTPPSKFQMSENASAAEVMFRPRQYFSNAMSSGLRACGE